MSSTRARHARGTRKPTVARQQRRIEDLGERHVDRVIRAQVLSKRPDPIEQGLMGVPLQIQGAKTLKRGRGFRGIQLAVYRIAPERLNDLDIRQVRHVQADGRIGNPRGDRLSGGVSSNNSTRADASRTITERPVQPESHLRRFA